MQPAVQHCSLDSELQACAFLPEHDGEVGVRAWLRGVWVVDEAELESIRLPRPHPSGGDAVAHANLGDVGHPSPPLKGHSVGNVQPAPVVEGTRCVHHLERAPDLGLAHAIVRNNFPRAKCRERTVRARDEVLVGRRGRRPRVQALQHCVAFRDRCDVLGDGIARRLRAWVETPVGAVCDRDDEIDARAAVAVGVFDAQDGLGREACDADGGHLLSDLLARDVILPPWLCSHVDCDMPRVVGASIQSAARGRVRILLTTTIELRPHRLQSRNVHENGRRGNKGEGASPHALHGGRGCATLSDFAVRGKATAQHRANLK